MSGNSTLRI